jgi:hypothetical protein
VESNSSISLFERVESDVLVTRSHVVQLSGLTIYVYLCVASHLSVSFQLFKDLPTSWAARSAPAWHEIFQNLSSRWCAAAGVHACFKVHIELLLYKCQSNKSVLTNARRRLVTKQHLRTCLKTDPQPYLPNLKCQLLKQLQSCITSRRESRRIMLAKSEKLQNCVYFEYAIGCTYH